MAIKGKKLIVANTGSDSLSIVDILNNFKVENISLLKGWEKEERHIDKPSIGPHQLILSENENIVYTVNSYNNSLFKVNINKKIIEDVIYVGCFPTHLQIFGDFLYITNSDSNSISVIDIENFLLIENISVGEKPHDIKFNKNDGKIYVANNSGYSISVIGQSNHEEETIRMKSNPLHILIDNNKMYILSSLTNGMLNSNITVLDLEDKRVINSIDITGVAMDMVLIKEEDILFVTNGEDGYLYKLDMANSKVSNSYHIGGMPNGIIWDEENLIFITDALNNSVIVFDYLKGEIIKNIEVGLDPNGLILI